MKSLFLVCLLLVVYGMAVSLVIEYSFNAQLMDWTTAQNYCRQQYGDLAIITTEEENQRAVKVIGQDSVLAWIGLKRTTPNGNDWKWSYGEEVNFTKWAHGEPNNLGSIENCAVMNSYGWYDTSYWGNYPPVCCRRFVLVKENKTWDEALKYCRTYYTDLTFVDSGTQLDLLKTETKQAQTASVWTGLRFLDGQWFWVNGMPLGSLVSLSSCPVQPYRCGAYNFNTNVWENRDCNKKLNFLCYKY